PPAAAPPAAGRPARRWWLLGGGVGVFLLLALGLAWFGGLFSPRPQLPEVTSPPVQQAKPPAPKIQEKARPLEAKGPKETEDVFLMPSSAPDKELVRRQPGDKVFLSDLYEFAVKNAPLNWPFAKNGRVGDPKSPGAMIRVQGTEYPKGLGMHPPYT